MAKNNYYAVKGEGIEDQIFESWSECQAFVRGKYVKFRGFVSLPEARAFLRGEIPPKTKSIPKKGEQEALLFDIKPQKEDGIFVFVDGSYMHGKSKYGGWGFVVVKEDIELISAYGKTLEVAEARNIDGELEATMQALTWIEKNMPNEPVTICHDYVGIAKWAKNEWKANKPLTQRYKLFMQSFKKVKFRKIMAHTGNKFNEMADQLAKKGITESL